jgi:hypothetical protein
MDYKCLTECLNYFHEKMELRQICYIWSAMRFVVCGDLMIASESVFV